MRGLPDGARRFLRLGRERSEVDDEIAFHYAQLEDELVEEGLTREAARAEARRRFGDERVWRRRMEAMDRGTRRRRFTRRTAETMLAAVRTAARGLAGSPGITMVVVLAFALGIGANATVYAMLDRLLLSPPAHVADPDEVRRLLVQRTFLNRQITGSTISFADVEDFRESSRFAAVAAYSPIRTLTIGRGEDVRRAGARLATGNLFEVLGTAPALGRFFTVEEDVVGGDRVAVLGHGFWQHAYGGSRDVLGRTIDFGHGAWTIIGVAPEGFSGIDLATVDIWLPLHPSTGPLYGVPNVSGERGFMFVNAVVRIASNTPPEAAEADATRLHRLGREAQIARGSYDPEARVLAAPLIAAQGPTPSNEVKVTRWLAGVSAVVLLIACINVANLLLGRALRRRRETAIRLALGVSRARLVADSVADGLLLALLGGAAALAAARWGGVVVQRVVLPNVDWSAGTLTPRLLLFTLICAVVAGLATALVPALQTMRADVNEALRASAGGITRSTLRTRTALSVAQAALSVLLLVGAGLFLRSLQAVGDVDLGFDGRGLLHATLVTNAGALDAADLRRLHLDAPASLRRLPFVQDAATSTATPFYDAYAFPVRVPGLDSLPRSSVGGPYGIAVSEDFMETMRIPIVRGRSFTAADGPGAPAVVIVNKAFADMVWPGEDALGKCMHIGEYDGRVVPCAEIIGIAATAARGSIVEDPVPQYYTPLAQPLIERNPNALFIRVSGDPGVAANAVRSALLAMDPALRHAEVRPLLELTEGETRPWRLGAMLFTLFGLIALLVAALGLYSVLAFDVTQRIREIGLRTALGARLLDVVRMIVLRGTGMAAIGVVIGLGAAGLIADRMEGLLFETSARDPVTYGAAALLLVVVAGMASAVPAWRAARIEPTVALKAD